MLLIGPNSLGKQSFSSSSLSNSESTSLSSSSNNPNKISSLGSRMAFSDLEHFIPRFVRRLLLIALVFILFGILLFDDQEKLKWFYWRDIRDLQFYMGKQSFSNDPPRGDKAILQKIGDICYHVNDENISNDRNNNRIGTREFKKKIINNRHAIVLDAGSTGSRIHVYEFQYCGEKLIRVADEVFQEVKPGLSNFGEKPLHASDSLIPLIETAARRIPEFLRKCTPLVLKATAGLRLLSLEKVDSILSNIRSWLRNHSFALGYKEDSVSVMEGTEEGVFAWITINFLQENIGAGGKSITSTPLNDSLTKETKMEKMARLGNKDKEVQGQEENENENENEKISKDALLIKQEARGEMGEIEKTSQTSVIFDLGGGSTQIVFDVTDQENESFWRHHKEYYYELDFHDHKYFLYQHSYLGFGLMEARKRIKLEFLKSNYGDKVRLEQVEFACFPQDYQEILMMDSSTEAKLIGKKREMNSTSSNWNECTRIVKEIFHKEDPCPIPPCSFNSVHHPIDELLRKKSLVAFSYIYDRIVPLGLGNLVTLNQVATAGMELCNSNNGSESGPFPSLASSSSLKFEDLIKQNPQWCLDLAYIYSLMTFGYGIPLDRSILLTKQLNGYEAGWSLGVALKLVGDYNSKNKCPVLQALEFQ